MTYSKLLLTRTYNTLRSYAAHEVAVSTCIAAMDAMDLPGTPTADEMRADLDAYCAANYRPEAKS